MAILYKVNLEVEMPLNLGYTITYAENDSICPCCCGNSGCNTFN